MATKIIFKIGDPVTLTQPDGITSTSVDSRLIDIYERPVAIYDNSEIAGVGYSRESARSLGLRGGATFYFRGQTLSGESLSLPQVESVTHVRSERIE